MILENALLSLLELETYDGGVWSPWAATLNNIVIVRGGKRRGVSPTVEVGTLTAVLVNSGDPLAGGTLKPNLPIRLRHKLTNQAIYTGRMVDLYSAYKLNKKDGTLTTLVTITAADAVAAHANTTRYGAVTAGGAGFESWAQRIIRLSSSSATSVNPPADDSPIVRYAI